MLMVQRTKKYDEFEAEQLRQSLSVRQKYRIIDGLWAEARSLGVWPPSDPLEGIEVDARLAKALKATVV